MDVSEDENNRGELEVVSSASDVTGKISDSENMEEGVVANGIVKSNAASGKVQFDQVTLTQTDEKVAETVYNENKFLNEGSISFVNTSQSDLENGDSGSDESENKNVADEKRVRNEVQSEDFIKFNVEDVTTEDLLSSGNGSGNSASVPKSEKHVMEEVQTFYPEFEFTLKTVSNIIQEGKAYIIKQSENVFYNPVQEFNRDLSVLAISVFSEEHQNDPRCQLRGKKRKVGEKEGNDGITAYCKSEIRVPGVKCDAGIVILEALSATGLRSIRYAKEVAGVKEIVANDISVAAVESIKKNIEYNSIGNLVTTSHNDASLLMYMRKAQGSFFDVVDLDPYGCPARFLDAAVQCVRDGGLLLITCTDMAVLAGNSPETCYVKYGAISLRNPACHEMALRIALQCVESHANRYGRYIVPQLSFSADFYIRVIVKVYTSPAMCKKTTSKLVMLYQCVGCQSIDYWPLGVTESINKSNVKYHLPRGPPVSQECSHCGSLYYQGGPVWSGPLHNTVFVEKMLSKMGDNDFVTEKRMEGMLELIKEELVGSLLYHTIDSLCSKVHCEVIPRNKFVSAILHAGYKVTLSHAAPNSLKTNAPTSVIWDIIRCWVQEHPVNPKRLNQGSVAERLLSVIPKFQANFDLHPEVLPRNRKKLLRYQQNPQPFWGPGTRDKNNYSTPEKMNRSYVNQNKKCKRDNIERERAQMKAAINSKTIDIIEVVTLTDDDDDDDDDADNDDHKLDESNNHIITNDCKQTENNAKNDDNISETTHVDEILRNSFETVFIKTEDIFSKINDDDVVMDNKDVDNETKKMKNENSFALEKDNRNDLEENLAAKNEEVDEKLFSSRDEADKKDFIEKDIPSDKNYTAVEKKKQVTEIISDRNEDSDKNISEN